MCVLSWIYYTPITYIRIYAQNKLDLTVFNKKKYSQSHVSKRGELYFAVMRRVNMTKNTWHQILKELIENVKKCNSKRLVKNVYGNII